jgi:hypothetical protein
MLLIINCITINEIISKSTYKSLIRLKKYKSYKGEQGKIAPNILKKFQSSCTKSKMGNWYNRV